MAKEKCGLCGEETEYDEDLDISLRKYYVEGAGQLCESCFYKAYHEGKRLKE